MLPIKSEVPIISSLQRPNFALRYPVNINGTCIDNFFPNEQSLNLTEKQHLISLAPFDVGYVPHNEFPGAISSIKIEESANKYGEFIPNKKDHHTKVISQTPTLMKTNQILDNKEMLGQNLDHLAHDNSTKNNFMMELQIAPQPTQIYATKERYCTRFINPKLPLPSHYKQLLKVFIQFDIQLYFLKAQKRQTSFSNIKAGIEKLIGRQFTQQHFEQFLFLEPRFFLYRWEPRESGKGHELVINIPCNIKQILESSEVQPSQKELTCMLRYDQLQKRKNTIEQQLLIIAHMQYNEQVPHFAQNPVNRQLLDSFDILSNDCTAWPHFFDYYKLKHIPMAVLVDKPVDHGMREL